MHGSQAVRSTTNNKYRIQFEYYYNLSIIPDTVGQAFYTHNYYTAYTYASHF